MSEHLIVRLKGERVGLLTRTEEGSLSFRYDEDWRGPALSVQMPVGEGPVTGRVAEAFFGGLLPEENARRRLARYLGVSERNDYGLLELIGGECAGAVSVHPESEDPPPPPADAHLLTEAELADVLRQLRRRPLMAGGVARLSLAGAQDKVAVCVTDQGLALPAGDEPTTHILKLAIDGFEDTLANECLCMRLAPRVGLAAAPVELGQAEDQPYLLVERYDREVVDGRLSRLHQEDFCQALGVPAQQKYEAEGGPGFAEAFALLTSHAARPAVDRLRLLQAAIFQFLVGNADAHAKNYALLYRRTRPELAPLYDVLSTLVYEGLDDKLAMKIGGEARFDWVMPRHWKRFAEEASLTPAVVRRDLLEMAETLPAAARDLRGTFPESAVLDAVVAGIEKRCRKALA